MAKSDPLVRPVWPEMPQVSGYTGAGCPVCGYGVDWALWPNWVCMKSMHSLFSLILGWLAWEYVCSRCLGWARAAGADWDGKLKFGFTGFKVAS